MPAPVTRDLPTSGPFNFALTGEVLARLPAFNALERFTPAAVAEDGIARHERALLTPAGVVAVRATALPAAEGNAGGPDGGVRLQLAGPAAAWPAVTAWAEPAFGLRADPSAFEAIAARDRLLAPAVEALRGLRPPVSEPWEAMVGAIVSQQITLRLALRQLEALARQFGGQLPQPTPDPLGRGDWPIHPTPLAILEADPAALRGLGLSGVKVAALKGAASAALDGTLDRAATLEAGAAVALLTALRGIGPWTARYWLTAIGRFEALATTDAGLRGAYRALNNDLEGLDAWAESLGETRGWAYWYLIWRAKR